MAKLVTLDKDLLKTNKNGETTIDIYDLVDCITDSLGNGSIADRDVVKAMSRYTAEIDDTRDLAIFTLMTMKALESDIRYQGDMDPVYMSVYRSCMKVIKSIID